MPTGSCSFASPGSAGCGRRSFCGGPFLTVRSLGLAVLVQKFHVELRHGHAVLNQIVAYSIGRGWLVDGISPLVTVALALAANTSFGGLPVLPPPCWWPPAATPAP